MADVIRKATNRFTKGLIMDFSPENTKNEVLTNALNATLLTFNGNELSLQNDMGNGRVETAYLPEGYMPVGTCEYGGIIYIVSYNPLEDKSLIGCFPSPERNISSDELGIPEQKISRSNFLNIITDTETGYSYPDPKGDILHNTSYVILKNDNLNPGDKFIVCANEEIYDEQLADLWVKRATGSLHEEGYVKNPIIALNVVSIEDSGKIVYLNSDIRLYQKVSTYTKDGKQYTDTYSYHIVGKMLNGANVLAKDDLDSYRNVLSSGYSVFKSKTSGKLAILAELIMIDSYSVTHSLLPKKDELGNIIEGAFDIVISTEVTPEITQENFNLVPKLQYYYLENSLGYIQYYNALKSETTCPLYVKEEDDTKEEEDLKYLINPNFMSIKLYLVYEPINMNLDLLNPSLGLSGKFNFPKPKTYHGSISLQNSTASGEVNTTTYTKFTEGKYHRINVNLVKDNANYYKKEILAKFYYYKESEEDYMEIKESEMDSSYEYYIKKTTYAYINAERNIDHKNKELFKVVTIPSLATESIIDNKTITKYKEQTIVSYPEATTEDLTSGKPLFEKDGNEYVQLIGVPLAGQIYYIMVSEKNLVSIGEELPPDIVPGDIYYYPDNKLYDIATLEEIDKYYDFETYPLDDEDNAYGSPITLYWQKETESYVKATEELVENFKELGLTLYYKTDYILIPDIASYTYEGNLVFIIVPIDTYVSEEKFKPDPAENYINGINGATGEFPKDDPLFIYSLSDFIPKEKPSNPDLIISTEKYYKYKDIILANITIPKVVSTNGLDLPFKYDYTIVPCMNYGKLKHLAVSNTIDFSKLHAFNLSNFSTWKYRIDNNQLRLTFGADIYDTYESDKVDGLILEFYDNRGFAGSLEILDKKSYSGIFTKIIPLNSFKALSKKKIFGNTYSEVYKRNINIGENGELEGVSFPVQYLDDNVGWSMPDFHEKTGEDLNDCGTLYSNVLYGVKTYLRRTTEKGFEFIKKKNFFLYTLPIYNEYYYDMLDFSNLTYPELELVLTYKLKDTSTKAAYSEGEIDKGFNNTDKNNVESYLGGFYDTTIATYLDLIKYYKYTGHTDLYLEVGLKKDYESLNMSYDPLLNDCFHCILLLFSNEDSTTTFTVNSGIDGLTGVNLILNYNNLIPETVNKLGFSDKNGVITNKHEMDSGIYNTNFINHEGKSPIKIAYEFVVGYTANISDIRSTQVQATTVCALFHKKPTGEYNFEDFGVYELMEGEEVKLLSSAMFYNEGTAEKEVFGICRQISTDDRLTMGEQCLSVAPIETDALPIKLPGKLNSGDPLRLLVGNIGKLTFCQPHAHGLSETSGVNIHEGDGKSNYGIPPEEGDWEFGSYNDDTYGIAPRDYLYNHPKYNLSLNTKNSINYHSEFISTVFWKELANSEVWGVNLDNNKAIEDRSGWFSVDKMREYTGFTGSEIATFNKKMIETMKYIYAYNPDYDSLTVNKGNISLQTYNPSFISNIVNTDSSLHFPENKTLNDFIYLGPVKFSKYLSDLKKHSISEEGYYIEVEQADSSGNVTPIPQVWFKENFDYCGTPDNKYLVSSLTYNTPVPREIESELEFSSSNITVVKHTDGSNTFIHGTPNKRVLYGYIDKYGGKMIQLDVSNYKIDDTGKLTISEDGAIDTIHSEQELDSTAIRNLYIGTHSFEKELKNSKNETSKVRLHLSLDMGSTISSFDTLGINDNKFIVGTLSGFDLFLCNFTLTPYLQVSSSDNNYKYNVKITKVQFKCKYRLLNNKVSLWGYPIPLKSQSYDTLLKLMEDNQNVTLIDAYGNTLAALNSTEFKLMLGLNSLISVNNNYLYTGSGEITPDEQGNLNFVLDAMMDPGYMGNYIAGLVEILLEKVFFDVIQTSKLEVTPESFISTTITRNYAGIIGHVYNVVSDYNEARLRGSSITINDLTYEPTPDGHRLFMKNNLCVYNKYLRGKLYYRLLDPNEGKESWRGEDSTVAYLNSIYLYTGPCYTSDNLNGAT